MKPFKTRALSISAVLITLGFLSSVPEAQAVPPPDFIINVASQIGNFFAIGSIFLLAILSTCYQFIKVQIEQHKKLFWVGGILAVLLLAGLGAYLLDGYYRAEAQKEANIEWQKESQQKAASPAKEKKVKQKSSNEKSALNTAFQREEDPGEQFIRGYYQDIKEKRLDEAYEKSKKSTSVSTFKSWYQDLEDLKITDLIKIDDKRYSLELTIQEAGTTTSYGVNMTLAFEGSSPTQIESSQVRQLSQKIREETSMPSISSSPTTGSRLWDQHKNEPLSISNQDFRAALQENRQDYIVLDARENIEFENGHLEGSTHIRFADLQAGRWIELPQNKYIYVLCWSGIRGKEVAEYLRTKELVSQYLQDGAKGWVDFGGNWDGNIKFTEVYTADRYKLVFTTAQVRDKISQGIQIVDSRPPQKFIAGHLPGSVNIPVMYTPTSELENAFGQIQETKEIIIVCDDYVNCFDAKLAGVELERRGHTFLGRFNRPWEF